METLYLPSSEYNTELIVVELARIFKEKGGVLCWSESNKKPIFHKENDPPHQRMIINRSLKEKEEDLESRVKYLQSRNLENNYANEVRKEYEKVCSVDNTPVITYGMYLSVILDGVYYQFEFEDNLFFGGWYVKAPVKNNAYRNCYASKSLDISYDFMWSYFCTAEQRKEVAEKIFNKLMDARYSELYGNSHMYVFKFKDEKSISNEKEN